MPTTRDNIIDKLTDDITTNVSGTREEELDDISSSFNKSLSVALSSFNSPMFDDDGFIKRMGAMDLGDKNDKDVVKNVLNNVRNDYINPETLHQSELLLRRDIYNICTQMPEMHDVISTIRDAIIECNVSTGEVSRSAIFENHENDETYDVYIKDLELHHNLQISTKNFIVPKLLMHGEYLIQVTPYAKLFAELEAMSDKNGNNKFRESVPPEVLSSFSESTTLYNDENLKLLMESVSNTTKIGINDETKVATGDDSIKNESDRCVKETVSAILQNIDVYNSSSIMFAEYGVEGMRELLKLEYNDSAKKSSSNPDTHFMEAMGTYSAAQRGIFDTIDQDNVDITSYSNIKGSYVKYLDGLRTTPIKLGTRIIGYLYISTTMDLQTNAANPNGIIDLSYQTYTKDRNMVDTLANMIIKSFNKKMLEKNIQLKSEIVEIIMAHKFSEGRLSFIYIPENEVVRFVINEDENGRGHSVLEPTLFPARMYLMLTLYNMLYTLNNNTTRIHYLKSSGLNKDYASQIQRTMRKFQQRRIGIDDIFSYQGVLNKVGGMGELVLPAGRNDYKALETDTIEAVQNPISLEFLEQQRRQAISDCGVPNLMIINAIDEVDFAKTLELANARFLSTVSSYKIDINHGMTKLYQKLLKYDTDLPDDVIKSFRYKFNEIKQQDLVITSDMIQNFDNIVNTVESFYYSKAELEDKDGNAKPIRKRLRKELAKKYLPQLNFDELDEVIKKVDLESPEDELRARVDKADISAEDLKSVNKDEEE